MKCILQVITKCTNPLLLLFFTLTFFLTACATKTKYTIFLKESNTEIYNLIQEKCRVSGWTQHEKEGKWILVEYYYNCDIRLEREMREEELKDWGIQKKKGSIGLQ